MSWPCPPVPKLAWGKAGPPNTASGACGSSQGLWGRAALHGRDPSFPPGSRMGGAPGRTCSLAWTALPAGRLPAQLRTHPSNPGFRRHPPGNLSLTRGDLGPAWLPQAGPALPFSPRSRPAPPARAPTQQRHPDNHDLAPSELGVHGPSPAGFSGHGEGQGELKPSRCAGIRAAFRARLSPQRPGAASEGIYCPLLLVKGTPCSHHPEGLGAPRGLGRSLGLGSPLSTVTIPQISPTCPLCPQGPIPDSPTATDREGFPSPSIIPLGPGRAPSSSLRGQAWVRALRAG